MFFWFFLNVFFCMSSGPEHPSFLHGTPENSDCNYRLFIIHRKMLTINILMHSSRKPILGMGLMGSPLFGSSFPGPKT